MTRIAEAGLIALADAKPGLQGLRRHGLEILAPERILEARPDVVAISSCFFCLEIYQELAYLEEAGVELVGFYGPLSRQRLQERL